MMTSLADMEFVTSDTNGTCVKCFWDGENLSKINAKSYQFCEICQIQTRVVTK